MRNGDSPDLRKWPRLPISFPVFARGVDMDGRQFKELATAHNISAGGMLVAVSRRLAPAQQLLLDIPVPPNEAFARNGVVREMKAQIIRVVNHDRYKLLGLKFSRPIT